MDQRARMGSLDAFKTGSVDLIVCSDVAARGLDIPDVSHVFNFDVPTHAEDYVHRIGRTGRAGNTGTAVTFIIPRLLPTDPVEQTLRRVSTSLTDPRAAERLRNALQDLYGLQGTPLEQYGRFWARLVRADLGPSLGAFPTPVTQIIRDGLPWTVGLLGASTLLSWLLGIILGTLGVFRWAAAGMLLGILVTTAMFLWTLQRVLMGKVSPEWAKLPRLTRREVATLLPLIGLILLLGILPGPLVSIIHAALHGSNPLGVLLMRSTMPRSRASRAAASSSAMSCAIVSCHR